MSEYLAAVQLRVWAATVTLLREESDRLDAAADVLWAEAESEQPSTERTPHEPE